MNERVWRLIGGFLTGAWKLILTSWVALVAGFVAYYALTASRTTGVGIGWFSPDFMRMAAVSIPVVGLFFMEREVVTLPVSLKDVWRAKWLLATVGLTVLTASARGVAVVAFGRPHFDAVQFLWFTVIEFLSAGTCAACAVFLLKTPDLVARQSGTLRWVAGLTWLTMPLWCYDLRLYGPDAAHGLTPAIAGIVALLATVTYLGFRTVPVAHFARMPLGIQARKNKADADKAPTSEVGGWRRSGRPGHGVMGWVCREIAWAVAFGLGGTVFIAVLTASTSSAFGGATFTQAASSIFRHEEPFGIAFCPLFTLMWVGRIIPRVRALRMVPISTWTLACVVTAGPLTAWTTTWLVQMWAYRWVTGSWPESPPLSAFVLVVILLAVLKTALLWIGRSYFVVAMAAVANTVSIGLMQFGPTVAPPLIPIATTALGVLSLFLAIDHIILTRTNRLYRPSTSVV